MDGGKDKLFQTITKKLPNPASVVKQTAHGKGISGGFVVDAGVHEQVDDIIKHGLGEYHGNGVFGGSTCNAFGGISESFLGGLDEDVENKKKKLQEETIKLYQILVITQQMKQLKKSIR